MTSLSSETNTEFIGSTYCTSKIETMKKTNIENQPKQMVKQQEENEERIWNRKNDFLDLYYPTRLYMIYNQRSTERICYRLQLLKILTGNQLIKPITKGSSCYKIYPMAEIYEAQRNAVLCVSACLLITFGMFVSHGDSKRGRSQEEVQGAVEDSMA